MGYREAMATAIKGFRIRAYPTGYQQRLAARWIGAAGWLKNEALGIRSEAFRHFGLKLTGNDISKWLTGWKRLPGHEWLAETPATCLIQALRDLDAAFQNFFEGRARYPRRRKKRLAGSIRFQDVSAAAWAKGALKLPKLGRLALAEALPTIKKEDKKERKRAIVPAPNMVTLTRDAAGRYFVSFKAEVELEDAPSTGRSVGVDLGIKHLATLSTGEKIPAPKHYCGKLRYLKRQQRHLVRKQKGSRRREKQRLRVARAHAKGAEARENGLHEFTARLVREFDTISIEDLNVKGMGKNRHLAASLHDAAFGEFRRQLEYKASWRGKTVVAVDRYFPSSKRCSKCHHVLDELRLKVREWTCPNCGVTHDRDLNAADNLNQEGQRILWDEKALEIRAAPQGAGTPAQAGAPGDRTGAAEAVPGAVNRVDGRGTWPESTPAQVLPDEARSEPPSQVCPEQT